MKKLIIITGILLLAVAAFAQQNSRERARQNDQKHKSEATAKRTGPSQRTEASTARTVQNHKRETTAKRTVQNNSRGTTANRTVQNHSRQTTSRGTVQKYGNTSPGSRTDVRSHPGAVQANNAGRRDVSRTAADNAKPRVRNVNAGPANTVASSARHAEQRRNYSTPNRINVRHTDGVNSHYVPFKYKKTHSHYRAPRHVNVIWTPKMYREYRALYPAFRYWYYPAGYTIINVPAYNACFHIGEVRNVYGRIHEVWYSWSTDEYYLYFGGTYPYQDFTVILPGRDARRFNRYPEAFFEGRYIWVTGLVSTFGGKPEIMVKRRSQVHLY